MQIVLDTYGLNLSVKNKCFFIAKGNEKRMVHPSRVNSFLVTMPCRISSTAIILAASNQIAITICSSCGFPEAKLWSPRFANTSALRRNQYAFTSGMGACKWSKRIIKIKLSNQINNLKFVADRKPGLKDEAIKAISEINKTLVKIDSLANSENDWLKALRYFEAYAANNYWKTIGTKLPEPFLFIHRLKRNPTDHFNTSINYLYAMLRNHVETGVLSFGLDPALGCMHRDGYNLPSLVFDLMEPFRPITDRLLIEAILSGKLKNIAEPNENEIIWLTKPGRRKLIQLFNDQLQRTMLYENSKTTLLNHILVEIKQLTNEVKEYGNKA